MAVALAGVCLALVASAAPAPVRIPATHFTLAWTHSIEKTRWEETYAIERTPQGLRLLAREARIRGSGAGMEPPAGSVLRDGWYAYRPTTPPLAELRLTRSPFTADYDWCVGGHCRPLEDLLPSDGGVTRLWPCEMTAQPPGRRSGRGEAASCAQCCTPAPASAAPKAPFPATVTISRCVARVAAT